MSLTNFTTLLTSPPGSLGYHLALSVTLGLLLWLSALYGTRPHRGLQSSWAYVAPGLLSVRLVLFMVDGLTWFGTITGSTLLAPLDRFSSLVGVAAFAWASFNSRPEPKADRLLFQTALIATLGLVGTMLALSGTPAAAHFNGTLADRLWGVAGLALALAVTLGMAMRRPGGWKLALAGFALLTIGYALHLFIDSGQNSLAGFVRLAELTAYPLISLQGAQVLASEEAVRAAGASEYPIPSLLTQIKDAPQSTALEGAANGIQTTSALDSTIRLKNEIEESQRRIAFLEQEIVRLGRMAGLSTGERSGREATPSADTTHPVPHKRSRMKKPDGTWLDLPQESGPRAPTDGEDVSIHELQVVLDELAETRSQLTALRQASQVSHTISPGSMRSLEAVSEFTFELSQQASSTRDHIDILLDDSVGLLGGLQRKFLERVRNNVERMGTLIEDLMSIVEASSSVAPVSVTPIEFTPSVEQAIEQVRPKLKEKQQSLEINLPEQTTLIAGEEGALEQLMDLILNHAIEVSPKGSSLVISAENQYTEMGGFLVLSVTDSGEGIPLDDLGLLFKQLHGDAHDEPESVTDRVSDLAHVRALSDAMGWRLWVDSEAGKGSTFTLLMPHAAQPSASTAEAEDTA